MAAEPRLLHRIFIGVETPIVIPDPMDGYFFVQEDGTFFITENNKYLTPENN